MCSKTAFLPEVLLGCNSGARLEPVSTVFLTLGLCFSPEELVSNVAASPPDLASVGSGCSHMLNSFQGKDTTPTEGIHKSTLQAGKVLSRKRA